MVNKVILVGNLGRDTELRYTPGGAAVAKFSLATTEKWTDKAGAKQERTEWHNCVLWGKSAEALAQYLSKGKQVYVEGSIQTHEYTDKEGVKRKATDIRVGQIKLLGGGGGRRRAADDDDLAAARPEPDGTARDDDDIPF